MKIKEKLQILKPFHLQIALFAATLSLLFQPLYSSIGYNWQNKFNRVFGNATLYGIDASERASNVLLFNLIIIPACIIAAAQFVYWFVRKAKDIDKNVLDFLNFLTICAFAFVFQFIYAKYSESRSDIANNFGFMLLIFLIFLTLLYIRKPNGEFSKFKLAAYLSIACTFLIAYSAPGILSSISKSSIIYATIFGTIFLATLAILKRIDISRAELVATPLFLGIFICGAFLEATNILNQHNVFIVERSLGVKIIVLSAFAIGLLLFLLKKKASEKLFNLSIVGLLIGLVFLNSLPPLKYTAGVELFEQANNGMLVNDVLQYGKIPVLNSFDGHMLSDSLDGLLFGWLNGNTLGASYVNKYLDIWGFLASVVIFLLLRELFNQEFAFFYVLFIPQFSYIFPTHYFGLIAILALLYALREKSIFSYIVFLSTLLVLTLYEVPTALSYGGGSLLVLLGLLIFSAVKEKKFTVDIKKFLIAFGSFVFVCLILYIGLCLAQSINPLKRAMEFLSLCLSTNNWAYASVGNNTTREFSLLYSVLPIVAILGSIFAIIHFNKDRKYIIALALLFAYFLNFSRAFGRHSLEENAFGIVIWSGVLGLMFLFSAAFPKINKQAFVGSGLAMFLILGLNNPVDSKSIIQNAYETVRNPAIYASGATTKVERVDLSGALSAHQAVLETINTFIPADETYIDLSSYTMLYALSGHQKPVYIDQSPLQLSGEFSQEQFIQEIKNFGDKCNYALLTSDFFQDLDGIHTQYKYYLVYEYLYENYRPLVKTTDNFSLWVKKDKYDQAYQKLIDSISYQWVDFKKPLLPELATNDQPDQNFSNPDDTTLTFPKESPNSIDLLKAQILSDGKEQVNVVATQIIDNDIILKIEGNAQLFSTGITSIYETTGDYLPIGYDYRDPSFHTYSLGDIPFIWGMYDKQEAWNNTVVPLEDSGLIPANKQGTANYILLKINASGDELSSSPAGNTAVMDLLTTDGKLLMSYNFSLQPGENRYLFRVSSDWYWNNGNDLKVTIKSPINITSSLNLLLGD